MRDVDNLVPYEWTRESGRNNSWMFVGTKLLLTSDIVSASSWLEKVIIGNIVSCECCVYHWSSHFGIYYKRSLISLWMRMKRQQNDALVKVLHYGIPRINQRRPMTICMLTKDADACCVLWLSNWSVSILCPGYKND